MKFILKRISTPTDSKASRKRLTDYFQGLSPKEQEVIQNSPNGRIEGESIDSFAFRIALKRVCNQNNKP